LNRIIFSRLSETLVEEYMSGCGCGSRSERLTVENSNPHSPIADLEYPFTLTAINSVTFRTDF
jgi:hypothetical protein